MDVGLDQVEKYASSNYEGSGFFTLKEDKECKKIRLLYNAKEDIKASIVHEVQVNGKKRYVKCLRAYDEPVDNCPFCKNGQKALVKYFIPVYDVNENKTYWWERGAKFASKLSSLVSRYPHLVGQVFEVERNGKPKDPATDYVFYPIGEKDNTNVEDYPEIGKLGLLVDETKESCENFLATGSFISKESNGRGDAVGETPYPRRTPSNPGNQF